MNRLSSRRLRTGRFAFPTVSSSQVLPQLLLPGNLPCWDVQNHNLHSTPARFMAVRRRRRRGDTGEAPKEEDGGSATTFEEHSALTDPILFEEKGHALLAKLGKAVEPMIAINDPFEVTRTQHMLKIAVEKAMGSYEVEMDPDERVVILRSPISGAHSYFFSNKTEEWIDTVDFHSLEGIFVRDLIRHCKGVPKL